MLDTTTICLIIGFIISFVVSALKKIQFVKDHPKLISLFINTVVGIIVAFFGHTQGFDAQALAACILTQFSSSVMTHEVITNTITEAH